MTSTRSHRFLTLGFMISAIVIFLAARYAMAGGMAAETCSSCTTLPQFQQYASQHIPAGAYSSGDLTIVHFMLVNPGAGLFATMTYEHFYDDGTGQWVNQWFWGTNSTAEMEQDFAVVAPQLAVQIPSSVATTFTGTSQAAAVSTWLVQDSAGVAVPLGTVVVTVFPDSSGAEYQVTGTNPLTYSFVSNTGHAANGDPENDSGEELSPPTYNGLTSQQTISTKPIQAQLAHDEKVEQSTFGPKKLNYGAAAIMGLCGPGCKGIFGLGDWSFNQCVVTGAC